eukprot:11224707-Lingulodinium_polyedra.AAC.1
MYRRVRRWAPKCVSVPQFVMQTIGSRTSDVQCCRWPVVWPMLCYIGASVLGARLATRRVFAMHRA